MKVTATAVAGAAHLQMPRTLDFGDVPVGTSATRAFQITNTGNVPDDHHQGEGAAGAFSTTTPIAEGLKIPAANPPTRA